MPQLFADVDRDKALKQGVALADVYQTLQTFLGGCTSTTSTASAGSGASSSRPKPTDRTSPEDIGQFYVRNNDGEMVPLSSFATMQADVGPEYTIRFNLYRAARSRRRRARLQLGQALDALEEVRSETLPPEIGYDWTDLRTRKGRRHGGTIVRRCRSSSCS